MDGFLQTVTQPREDRLPVVRDTGELSICGALIWPSTSVRDLGVLLESDLSMRRHVAWTVGFPLVTVPSSSAVLPPFHAANESVLLMFFLHFWRVGCCFRQLRLIRSCIKSLPLGAAKAAVAAFVTSRVDRCNSLLASVPPGRTPVGAQCRSKAYL